MVMTRKTKMDRQDIAEICMRFVLCERFLTFESCDFPFLSKERFPLYVIL